MGKMSDMALEQQENFDIVLCERDHYKNALMSIAHFTLDGEIFDQKPYKMTINEAYEGLEAAVSVARNALGLPVKINHDPQPERKNDA